VVKELRYHIIMIVDLATSVKYGNYKKYKLYGEIITGRILDHEDGIRQTLNLPDKIHIRLRPIRHFYGLARYHKNDEMTVCSIEIDIKQELQVIDNTLIHELIHAEQYHENRLTHTEDKKWFKWKGEEVSNKYKNYIELPWEAEAYTRADILTPKIFRYK
jgi:hypothetical protein